MTEQEAISLGYICRNNQWYMPSGKKVNQQLKDYDGTQALLFSKRIGIFYAQIRRASDAEPYWKQTTLDGTEQIAIFTIGTVHMKGETPYLRVVIGRYILNAAILQN